MENKFCKMITSIAFFGIIFIVFILNVVSKDVEISVSERRKLTLLPEISFKSFINGTFFNKFDSYVSDQFIYRDSLRTQKAKIDLLVKDNYHSVYKYNNCLIEQIYPISEESINNFTNILNNVVSNVDEDRIYYTVVPDKNYFVKNNQLKIDYDYFISLLNDKFNNYNYINIFDELNLDNYYCSDSHWKQETLEDVSKFILSNMNSDVDETYEMISLSNFKGVYSYQVPVSVDNDEIVILNNNIIENSKVYNYVDNEYSSVYNLNKINSYDKYDVYLSGATSLIRIDSNSKSDKELVVFRDSFGSSIVPLFTSSYSKIYVVDLRYISSKLLDNYIDLNNKDILFLYNVNSINNSFTMK